jgi:excisionase family DNA binding protein
MSVKKSVVGPQDGLRTIDEVMEFTRLSRAGVYALLADGRLPSVRFGRRRLVPAASLARLVEQNLVPGKGPG